MSSADPKTEAKWLERSFEQVKHDTAAVGDSWEPARMIGHAHSQARLIADLKSRLAYALGEFRYIGSEECCGIDLAKKAAGDGAKACDLGREFAG